MSQAFQPDSMPGYTLPVYAYRTPPELAGGGAIFGLPLVGIGSISPYAVQGRPVPPLSSMCR